jgi:hypothetical protein
VLELVDPEPETIDLGLELVVEAAMDYNCKDFDT